MPLWSASWHLAGRVRACGFGRNVIGTDARRRKKRGALELAMGVLDADPLPGDNELIRAVPEPAGVGGPAAGAPRKALEALGGLAVLWPTIGARRAT